MSTCSMTAQEYAICYDLRWDARSIPSCRIRIQRPTPLEPLLQPKTSGSGALVHSNHFACSSPHPSRFLFPLFFHQAVRASRSIVIGQRLEPST